MFSGGTGGHLGFCSMSVQCLASCGEVSQRGRELPRLPLPPKRGVNSAALEHGRRGGPRVGAIALEIGNQFGNGIIHSPEECRINAAFATAFTPLANAAWSTQYERVSEAAQQIREWMALTLAEKGWTARQWALAAKVSPSTIQRALKPTYEFVTSSKTLDALARAANVTPPNVASTGKPVGANLPILDTVQAGAFLLADDMDQGEPDTYPAALDPRYPTARQWLARVVGDSVNDLTRNGRPAGIYDGDLVQLVDAYDIGYEPQHDHVVLVERLRAGGRMRELTLKQIEVTPSGVRLCGRSTNPKWNGPISLTDGAEDGEEFEVRIKALMVQALRQY